MSDGYFVRITRSFSDLSGLVHTWAARADKMVVYEHCGDETEKVHIHMVIINPDVTKKQLKNLVPTYNLKGNGDWSFKNYDGDDTAMVYMTKGVLDPKYMKGYTVEDADFWKLQYKFPRQKPNRLLDLYEDCFGDEEDMKYQIQENRSAKWRAYEHAGTRLVDRLPETEIDFLYIKEKAKIAAFEASKRVWSQKTMNDYKSLVYTYIMRYNIQIPDKHKDWAKFW